MQLECAKSFQKAIKASEGKLLSEENKENLMTKSLEILNSGLDNEELLEQFKKVIEVLIIQLPLDYVLEEVLVEVFPLYQLKNKLESRVRASIIILAVIKVSKVFHSSALRRGDIRQRS